MRVSPPLTPLEDYTIPDLDLTPPTLTPMVAITPSITAADLSALIAQSLDEDKAQDVTIIDLLGKTSICDVMIIASGTSTRQVTAMAEHAVERLKTIGVYAAVEGKATGDWVLIDAGDVVVHVFRPEVREFYNLEKMWNAATLSVA